MKSHALQTAIVIVALSLTLAVRAEEAPGSESLDDLTEQVRAAETAFARTMADRDIEAFTRFLADEAVFFDGQNALKGKAAVVAGWRPLFAGDNVPFSWAPEVVVVLPSGTLAHSSGPVLTPDGKKVAVFNSVWRREVDGTWKVVFDKGCTLCE